MRFTDRHHAGAELARYIKVPRGDPIVVMALPRGGVPVARVIAWTLRAPLDVMLVRKIAAPSHPEYAIGAVAEGVRPSLFISPDGQAARLADHDYIERAAKDALQEIERRRQRYLADNPRPPLEGASVILVDDGVATGATMQAAILAARRSGAKRVIVAAPVIARDTVSSLKETADQVIALETPYFFGGVSEFYQDFHQLSDEEVIAELRAARSMAMSEGEGEDKPDGN